MRHLFVIVFCLLTINSFGQQKITLEEVKNHINDIVEIRSKVSEISVLKNVKNSPTVIYVGGKSPNQVLSIIIYADVRKKLGYNPQEEKFVQGLVIARGKLENINGKPQIVIKDPTQLGFIYDEVVAEPPPIIGTKNQ